MFILTFQHCFLFFVLFCFQTVKNLVLIIRHSEFDNCSRHFASELLIHALVQKTESQTRKCDSSGGILGQSPPKYHFGILILLNGSYVRSRWYKDILIIFSVLEHGGYIPCENPFLVTQ